MRELWEAPLEARIFRQARTLVSLLCTPLPCRRSHLQMPLGQSCRASRRSHLCSASQHQLTQRLPSAIIRTRIASRLASRLTTRLRLSPQPRVDAQRSQQHYVAHVAQREHRSPQQPIVQAQLARVHRAQRRVDLGG